MRLPDPVHAAQRSKRRKPPKKGSDRVDIHDLPPGWKKLWNEQWERLQRIQQPHGNNGPFGSDW